MTTIWSTVHEKLTDNDTELNKSVAYKKERVDGNQALWGKGPINFDASVFLGEHLQFAYADLHRFCRIWITGYGVGNGKQNS